MSEDAYTREQELLDMADPNTGWIPPIECASSFVKSISYNITQKLLVVEIQWNKNILPVKYPYFDEPFELFVEFVNSQSKGVFYNDHLKPGGLYYATHRTRYARTSGP